ncbi:IS110 family transposase [Dyadobacter fermentans]|uniref:IS110 family transposase n=1 Tax=Dyadobacter fermentans TaxID=94254 RepID=UPI001CC04CD0|nr:transposase [Dyadobacter fermentans]MBZ1361652.1 transposase [Dyadobacter fermentans]
MKQSKAKFFIGFDISKLSIDVAVVAEDKRHLASFRFANSESGIQELFRTLQKEYKCRIANSLLCAEDTGPYSSCLKQYVAAKKGALCLESPLQLARSIGVQRAKTDSLDALKIAKYALAHRDSLRLWERPRECIEQLKVLLAIRRRLLKIRKSLGQGDESYEPLSLSIKGKSVAYYSQRTSYAVKEDIKDVDKEILSLVSSDPELARLHRLMTSIPRVGIILSANILISTNEFKGITTAKKFACYCGVAPFDRLSGTSLRKARRVSKFANKELKALLHLAAIGFVNREQFFLGRYYKRKLEEGKRPMAVINAIRNKIIHRIYACVNGGIGYIDN